MRYMPITPVGFLETLDIANTTNVFILSQFWGNKKYREFYLKNHWDTVIIDNALYEESKATEFDDMVAMARQIDAGKVFVVGPEKLNDGIETGRMTIEICNEYDTEGFITDTIQLMCILHKRPNEMLEQWNMIKKYTDVALGISIFSYRLGYDRASLYKFVGIPTDRYVHAFGLDNLLELYNIKHMFNSVDSSIAVSAAVNNVDLKRNWQITRNPEYDGRVIKERVPIDWDNENSSVKFGKSVDAIQMDVLRNIKLVDKLCSSNTIFKESELPCQK